MDRPQLKKCKCDECSEMIVAGDFCWQHRQYNKAIITDYAKRDINGRQINRTVSYESKLIATEKKAKTIDGIDKT